LNRNRRTLLILALAAMGAAALISVTYVTDLSRNNSTSLPAGCVKPTDGFLVIASNLGYNDSIGNGAPVKPWPVITVRKGTTVNITACNTDRQAHGFQIVHYLDSSIETVLPGQVIRVSFVANKSGTYEIYCSIFCTVHVYMQNGELVVGS
jgi:cupredoxin-like protein